MADSLITNARILTMDAGQPYARSMLVRDGRIAALDVGPVGDAAAVDIGGRFVLPAFVDAHCHLLSFAASLLAADCSPAAVRSIADIQSALQEQALAAKDGWVRGAGYEETALAEGRHPDRHDLDAAVPDRPVRLRHRSGHASVLNSAGLAAAGIGSATEEPPGGFMDRDLETGAPTGLLLEMEEVIDGATPPLPYEQLAGAVGAACRRFLAAGVTAIQDATHTNGAAEWELFRRLRGEGCLPLDVTLMAGYEHRGELPERPEDGLRPGAVKIMLRELGGESHPDAEALAGMVDQLHAEGRQVAVHAVTDQGVLAAIRAFERTLSLSPRADHRHRLEHCSLLPPGAAERLAHLGVMVVTQPAFLYESGDRYLARLSADEVTRLYAVGSLARAGVRVAFSSDAPIAPPEPLRAVGAAAERRARSGAALAADQGVSREEALAMHTRLAALAGFQEGQRGSLRPGLAADFVVLSADPRMGEAPVEATYLRGECVFARAESN